MIGGHQALRFGQRLRQRELFPGLQLSPIAFAMVATAAMLAGMFTAGKLS